MPDSYHHGDLRRALLDEASAVLENDGVGALSLRDLARRTGVSPTAPYHHFQNKADLVAALAIDALEELDRELAHADRAETTPRARLRAQGITYVLFAVRHPERFKLAFRPEMGDPFTELTRSATLPDDLTAFRHLVRAVRDLADDPARQTGLAIAAWSLVHGLASLLVDGPLRDMASDFTRVRALAESVVDHLLIDPRA